MIKVNGVKVEEVDHEWAVRFPDDPEPLYCDDEEDALDAYRMARAFDGKPELLRRTVYITTWEKADDETVSARPI